MKLALNDFKNVVRLSSLFAFDLIIMNGKNEILLGERQNAPAKGYWFVPGGRVFKNEPLQVAFNRILKEETGFGRYEYNIIKIKGLFDHIYSDNYFGEEGFGTHYIICAVELQLLSKIMPGVGEQHNLFRFFSKEEILSSEKVHPFTKSYFQKKHANKFDIDF